MKKVLIFIPILWIAFSCKNEAKKQEIITDSAVVKPAMLKQEADSLTLDDFKKISTTKEQIEWLQANGKMVYSEILYKYYIDNHLVEYTSPIKEGFKNAPKTAISWATFQDTFGNYMFEKFVKFNEKDSRLELTLVDTFVENDLNYCIPLFKAIQKNYHLTDKSEIEVAKFRVAKNDVIAFSVKGETEVFDYNTKP